MMAYDLKDAGTIATAPQAGKAAAAQEKAGFAEARDAVRQRASPLPALAASLH